MQQKGINTVHKDSSSAMQHRSDWVARPHLTLYECLQISVKFVKCRQH